MGLTSFAMKHTWSGSAAFDICKCVRSEYQFGESSWVLQRTPSSLTCGNVTELHLFMWTLQTHSCSLALETKDIELPRGEWPGGQTHAYQLDFTPHLHHSSHKEEAFVIWVPWFYNRTWSYQMCYYKSNNRQIDCPLCSVHVDQHWSHQCNLYRIILACPPALKRWAQ